MRKFLILLVCSGIMHACTSCTADNTPEGEDPQTGLIFEDEFDTFNTSNWRKEAHDPGWVNNELQAYNVRMVDVGKDGDKSVLIITAKRDGDKIYSGRINSKGKQSFPFGKVEASIRLPETDGGLWPAFWMMGDNAHAWPKCGEIDILEMGHSDGIADGTSDRHVNVAIHYGETSAKHKQQYYAGLAAQNLQDGKYHTYTVERTSESITMSIDGRTFKKFSIPEGSEAHPYFQDNFYILFNLAVGGDFPDIKDVSKLTALKDGEEAKMYVDWVRFSK